MLRPVFTIAVMLVGFATADAQTPLSLNTPAPKLVGIDAWINSEPLELSKIEGKVIVVHFWTFGCINCIRNYPHYAGWQKDFADKGLVIVGVHTPETQGERDLERVRKKVKDNGMTYPIAVDGSAQTWKAWSTSWWPTIYLIDRQGMVRYQWNGELNWNGIDGEKMMRRRIERLLAEEPAK